MVLNYIWIAFFVIAFIFALIGLAMGDTTIFQKIVDSTFDSSKNAFEISLGLTGEDERNHEKCYPNVI